MSNKVQSQPPTRLNAKLEVTDKSKKPTLLTEELPAGGVTQEDFKHKGRNLNEEEDGEEE